MNKPPRIDNIELGDEVRDLVTGYQGIAMGRTEWLTGCDRICVQAPVKDGKIPDMQSFDVTTLRVVKPGVFQQEASSKAKPAEKPGGPMPTPKRF